MERVVDLKNPFQPITPVTIDIHAAEITLLSKAFIYGIDNPHVKINTERLDQVYYLYRRAMDGFIQTELDTFRANVIEKYASPSQRVELEIIHMYSVEKQLSAVLPHSVVKSAFEYGQKLYSQLPSVEVKTENSFSLLESIKRWMTSIDLFIGGPRHDQGNDTLVSNKSNKGDNHIRQQIIKKGLLELLKKVNLQLDATHYVQLISTMNY